MLRPRTISGSQRQSVRSTYENFKPRSEWRHDEKASVLVVYLPGFVNQQIRINWDRATRLIRIQGQRAAPPNRWVRFDESFRSPDSCDISQIQTQFGQGTLSLIIPKIVNVAPLGTNEDENKATQQALIPKEISKTKEDDNSQKVISSSKIEAVSPPKATSEPKSQKVQEISPQKATSSSNIETVSPKKVISEPKSQKGQEVSPHKASSSSGIEAVSPKKITSEPKSQKSEEATPQKEKLSAGIEAVSPQKDTSEPKSQKDKEVTSSVEALSPKKAANVSESQKGQVETLPKAALPSGTTKETDEKSEVNGNLIEVEKPKNVVEVEKGQVEPLPKAALPRETTKETDEKSEVNGNLIEVEKPENVVEFEKAPENTTLKTAEKDNRTAGDHEQKPYKEDSADVNTKEKESNTVSGKNAVKGLAMELSEDMKSLVNVGAAALVIIVLGASSFYSLGLSRN